LITLHSHSLLSTKRAGGTNRFAGGRFSQAIFRADQTHCRCRGAAHYVCRDELETTPITAALDRVLTTGLSAQAQADPAQASRLRV